MLNSKDDCRYRIHPATLLGGILMSGALTACHNNNNNMMTTRGLWIANGTNVLEYVPAQLAGGTSAAVPHRAINSAAFGAPQGVTFDSAGNLWVMDPNANVNGTTAPALLEFSSAQLAALGMKNTGTENYGGPIVTAGGLLFIGATSFDKKFRAFDKSTGELLWETTLPFAGNATPATYEINGRQFVVIAAGGGKNPKSPSGGIYVAFALPKK